MADKKITDFPSLAEADISSANDVLVIVDATGPETKKATVGAIVGAGLAAGVGEANISGPATIDGGAVFNESGADVDFRVESDTETNALFVQGSDGFVGIGTNTPIDNLTVYGGITISKVDAFTVTGSDATTTQVVFEAFRGGEEDTTGTAARIRVRGDGTNNASEIIFDTLDVERLRLADTEVVVNDPGNDIDFRVESDTVDHALFVDGATGNVGFGGAPDAYAQVQTKGTVPSDSGLSNQFHADATISSSATDAINFASVGRVEAASFTLSDLKHFNAFSAAFGAGATVTNQYGFFADSTLTGATNDYGFYSNIAAGSNRWNFYANGTARNYFAGGVEVVAGTTSMASGFTHIPSAAGAPTGAPTNPTGNVPMYYDATNHKIYVYSGGTWRSTAALT